MTTAPLHEGTTPPPPLDRTRIAAQWIAGSGLEIGALHNPLAVPTGTSVTYVDRMSTPDLRQHYPDLSAYAFVSVDIVDDGERLARIGDASQDFVIANHFLEHCEDPIGALAHFFRVLKHKGILFLAIPDKRFTFDSIRPVTPLQHLIDDHLRGPEHSRELHYREWVRLIDRASGIVGEESLYKKRTQERASIHFHVWTQKEMLELLAYVRQRIPFDTKYSAQGGNECIFVLQKTATQLSQETAAIG